MNSMNLGEVIEADEQVYPCFSKNAVIWLSMATFFGAATCLYPEAPMRFSVALAICAAALGVLTVVLKYWESTRKRTLQIHENGVSIVQFNESTASTEIHFCQLDAYTYKKTRTGLGFFELELKSNSLDIPQAIKWSSHPDPMLDPMLDFDALHVRISEKVAENLAAKLDANERVPWGATGFIGRNGVEVRDAGILFSKMRFIPWCEIRDIKFGDTKLYLHYGAKNHRVEISCLEPNLFAGFLLVDRRMKELYGDWMARRQSDEEMAYGMADVFVSGYSGG